MELILKKQSDCGHMVLEIGIMPDLMYLLINMNHKNNVCYVVNRISGYYSQVLMESSQNSKGNLQPY
jgi:Transposase IS200 like.